MPGLKLFAGSLASAAIIALTPVAGYASSPACVSCWGACIDAYGDDNSEAAAWLMSQCMRACLDEMGTPCMDTHH